MFLHISLDANELPVAYCVSVCRIRRHHIPAEYGVKFLTFTPTQSLLSWIDFDCWYRFDNSIPPRPVIWSAGVRHV